MRLKNICKNYAFKKIRLKKLCTTLRSLAGPDDFRRAGNPVIKSRDFPYDESRQARETT